MRLAEFILSNVEPILAEWETFARGIWPGPPVDPAALRDHAHDILLATAADMGFAQTSTQQSDKSKGGGRGGPGSADVVEASDQHAVGRVRSGFDLLTMVAEYRALRASVLRLWHESGHAPDRADLADITRFNESIDQSITEAIRSYSAMVERSRQMFLAILGHDLRSPVHAVTMSGDVLARSGQLDPELTGVAKGVASSGAAMSRMIGDLLDFTAAGLGADMPLSFVPGDLGKLCLEVVDEMRRAHATRTLTHRIKGDLRGEWDVARLRQAVSNLVGNAIQHGAGTGPIGLEATADAAGVRIDVRNGGPPIPPEALPTLFDPLVRGAPADPRKPRRPGSLGLGLYIAREVAQRHGGTLDVTSSPHDGTCFTLRLPRRPPAAAGAKPPPGRS
jgi:signal transduction histidine kinase